MLLPAAACGAGCAPAAPAPAASADGAIKARGRLPIRMEIPPDGSTRGRIGPGPRRAYRPVSVGAEAVGVTYPEVGGAEAGGAACERRCNIDRASATQGGSAGVCPP